MYFEKDLGDESGDENESLDGMDMGELVWHMCWAMLEVCMCYIHMRGSMLSCTYVCM